MEAGAAQAPWEPPAEPESESAVVDEFAQRPEIFVGAAFAGGLALALILRRFGSE